MGVLIVGYGLIKGLGAWVSGLCPLKNMIQRLIFPFPFPLKLHTQPQ
jgi:hypothetical protein